MAAPPLLLQGPNYDEAVLPDGCAAGFKVRGKTAVWVVNFNNGNVNNNHRNNNACVRAVRAGECHGEIELRALFTAWRAARAGKKPSQNQLNFDGQWTDGLFELQRQLNDGTWQPRRSACFVATRPKAREIHAPDFADRVVHHWLVPQLEAIWEPLFIFDSYANRRSKGSHAAVRRLQAFVREVHSGQSGGWYLQLDIHNFFNSIHRPILWAILKPRLVRAGVSQQVMETTHVLLRRHPLYFGVKHHGTAADRALVPHHKRLENTAKDCGLPIGNLSSQFFANAYLDKLDQFIKHTLKAQRYLRYVDDFVLIHQDRNQLEAWQAEIETFLAGALQLRLKQDIRLRPLADGIDFLGYVVRPTHTLVRRRVVAHARQTLADWEAKHVLDGLIVATPADLRAIQSTVASYQGHLRHANSALLWKGLVKRFWWLPTVMRPRKFDYRLEGQQITISATWMNKTGLSNTEGEARKAAILTAEVFTKTKKIERARA